MKKASKKQTWFGELQRPLLKAISPTCRKWEKAVASLPKCYEEPWVARVEALIEGSINKVFNLKSEVNCNATTLGILAAQSANCAEMDLAGQLKGKKLKPRVVRGMRKMIGLVSPMQEHLGKLSRKIMRVMARQPWETQVAFYNGYSRALEKKMFQGVNPIFFENSTTRLYMSLLFFAPWMHQVKSSKHLHDLLFPHLGSIVGRDPDRLEKVCQRIGLRFRTRATAS